LLEATADRGGAAGFAEHPDAADESLVDELRQAFELDAETLGTAGPCRLTDSSGACGRSLGAGVFAAGARLDDFEILGELGRGGMGVVYRARQVSLGREVALKVLPGWARYGPVAVRRFQVEAQAAARLHHTNIVPVYAQGEHGGHCYYAMELVRGVSLDRAIHSQPELLGPGRAPWARADYQRLAGLVAEVADALECGHRHGVIHRDVKPHNLLLGTDRRLRLTDFGLARLTDQPHLTLSGEVMGTPAYLSPEQVRGDGARIDHRTDVYSLGVTLYELLTRRKPFDGETREQIVTGICAAEPVAPRGVDRRIPAELEAICLRAMEKQPRRRYASAGQLAEDLRRFAEGRPILTRRRSRLEKAGRWMRRHKSLTVAGVATAAVGLLVAALAWSTEAARERQAERLLRDAYAQLAYFDYRAPELVREDLERAAALGADPDELLVARALACLGATDQAGAIRHLEAALQREPAEQRVLYLLAWAQHRDREYAAARVTFAEAERQGAPVSADAWFFRGLAIHFDQPATAIESYRQANALRAREHAFYPQAVLHLARARNQQMYATRSLDAFAEAEASLRQLVEQQQYGAYPHYLLAIAHRLAAEIYSGSEGTRDDTLVSEHYAEALAWARRGQEVEPDNDRPLTAEAECLESMGLYAEAIEARTRAIGTATKQRAECEGYHYRWRLHYWTGGFEAALQDVARHAECIPESRCYAHVYPALLLAELGRMPEALGQARALADEAPDSAQAVLWSATCLRLLGRAEEAEALLAERADTVDCDVDRVPPQSRAWVRALYEHCRAGGGPAELEALARAADSPWKLWGEAHFHAAALKLAEGDRPAALAGFRRARRSFDSELRYTFHGQLIAIRMRQDPDWPAWIPAREHPAPDAPTDEPAQRTVAPARDEEGGS
jgi:hypothetical protein